MAKVENYRLPFFDYEDIKPGEVVRIIGEFAIGGKFEKYQGPVQLANEKKALLSLNNTSVSRIVSKYGDDTEKWINKIIELSVEDVGQIKNAKVWNPTDKKLDLPEVAWDE